MLLATERPTRPITSRNWSAISSSSLVAGAELEFRAQPGVRLQVQLGAVSFRFEQLVDDDADTGCPLNVPSRVLSSSTTDPAAACTSSALALVAFAMVMDIFRRSSSSPSGGGEGGGNEGGPPGGRQG
eukprot:4000985-Prymnesium_polylepis.1